MPLRASLNQMKMPYFAALAGATKANVQGGRGGACTTYHSAFDPEVESLVMIQNPRTPVNKRNRDIHFAVEFNRFVAKKVAKNENMFLFNAFTAPDLMKKFFSSDQEGFEALYNKYEADPSFVKKYISARDLIIKIYQQRNEVATYYTLQIDEMNRHTPHLDTIYSSNLCLETALPTKGYENMMDLYTVDHERGEVSLCSLAGIVVSKFEDNDDESYEKACYYALKMIDKCIHMSDYPLPHVGYTAKNRLNAGIGMLGVAYHMAKKGLKFDTPEGLAEVHRLAERHAYFCIKASLKLGKELGNAPWMHKTKWPQGWLPIDTYKKTVDELVAPTYRYDWEGLRAEIIANGGIRNSSLINHMPTESSSKASGVPNSIYPVRDTSIKKTDLKNAIDWCAPDNDIIEDQYQLAWDIDTVDMMKYYAVIQKFTDQSTSADFYRDRRDQKDITSDDLIKEFLAMVKYGVKTQYYQNSYTVEEAQLESSDNSSQFANIPTTQEVDEQTDERGCAGGFCTL